MSDLYSLAEQERRHPEPAKSSAGTPGVAPRSPFERDRARVLHCASFRRLAGKTQVVAPDEDDVPRTRLTHSLEVAQISRGMGRQLGCDADLTDLAGLAHDIGHPPFGHNGEEALDRAGVAAGGFEANAQNIRLLTRLEVKVTDSTGLPGGLNLTRAALDAVLKYPWPRPAAGGKFGVYADDEEIFGWIRRGVTDAARCLEAQIMDWADDVAYSVHDVEDGILSGRLDVSRLTDPGDRDAVAAEAEGAYSQLPAADLRTVFDELLALPIVAPGLTAPVTTTGLKFVTSELTGRFVTGVVAATRAVAGPEPLRRYDADLVVPPRLRAEVALLKAMAAHYVMAAPRRRVTQQREQQVLTELVAVIADRGPEVLDPDLGPRYRLAADDAGRLRVVLDQVSLLTDSQAIARHRRLVRG